MALTFRESQLDLKDVILHYGEVGPADGQPVLFLHGFPDLWFTWEEPMLALAQLGYRAIAPDQRGYGRSSKPTRVSDYRIDALTSDIAHFIEALAPQTPVHLVGHDWGGAVAWYLASQRPDLVRSLTIVNVPHPRVWANQVLGGGSQLLRSSYMLLFQVPVLSELLFSLGDSALLVALLKDGGVTDEAKLRRYREEWRNPGATHAPLYWYRALVRYFLKSDPRKLDAPLQMPTRLLWGKNDPVFSPDAAAASVSMCKHGSVAYFDAGHWPFHEQTAAFNQELCAWLSTQEPAVGVLHEKAAP